MWRIGLRMLSMRKALNFLYSKLIIFKTKHQTYFKKGKMGEARPKKVVFEAG